MEVSSIDTAAKYINNLLLARGLLRNGTPIDFTRLAVGSAKGQDSNAVPTAHVINVIHDLILRKDRDQEHHESIALTLRSLRDESSRNHAEVERLSEQNRELAAKLATSQASVRAAQGTASAAENSARALRDELGRVKNVLTQVRAQCANDVRKRDVQIQRLKTHLSAQQRGARPAAMGQSITIVPGRQGHSDSIERQASVPTIHDAEYSLKQETIEFLTQLSQSLSDENDALTGLVRSSLQTLKELQGMPHNQPGMLLNGDISEIKDVDSDNNEDPLVQVPASFDQLSQEFGLVLGTLRDLLTNPAFAPIEEVEVREEEIHRLREAWEQMETRWTEAVTLMQSWRERMLSGGDSIGLEELKLGLNLGEGLEKIKQAAKIQSPLPASAHRQIEDSSEVSEPHERDVLDQLEENTVEEEDITEDTDENLFKIQVQPLVVEDTSLREVNGNSRQRPEKHQKARFDNIQTNVRNSVDEAQRSGGENGPIRNAKNYMKSTTSSRSGTKIPTKAAHNKASSISQAGAGGIDRRKAQESLDSSPLPPAPQIQMSIEDKLRFAEDEARRASNHERPSSPLELGSGPEDEGFEERARKSSPVKRTKMRGLPRRRKSTLSPEELEQLMLAS